MSTAPADIIILRGAPGVGKSRSAAALAAHFPSGAKVEVDALRKMVISVRWTDQEEHIKLLGLAAQVTGEFVKLGIRPVIVIDTFSGDKVDGFLAQLMRSHGPLDVRLFAMYANDAVLAQRLAGRPKGQFNDFQIARKLNADVHRVHRPEEVQIDTSALSPEQVAAQIVAVCREPHCYAE